MSQEKPTDGPVGDGTAVSRRRLLRATAAASTGVVLGTGLAAGAPTDDPVITENFEEREWGYVREDFEPPTNRVPFILSMDGYYGASGGGRDASPTHYVEMDDGTLVAVQLSPTSYLEPDGSPYWFALVSIRGTACSGGQFSLFDRRHARDGRAVIEWLADRPFAADGVGMYGASYSGITALHVASTQPPSLAAVSANMVIGDLYRGISYPGGVPNSVFPPGWTQGVRPQQDLGGAARGPTNRDPICAQNVAAREPQNNGTRVANELTWIYTHPTDDQKWASKSLLPYADRIEAPTYIAHAWQDEQTGPRGGVELFRAIDPDPVRGPGDVPGRGPPPGVFESPKLLRTTNGDHGTAFEVSLTDVVDWFDYWLRGQETGIMDESPVELRFETVDGDDGVESNLTLGADTFPPESAQWTAFYLRSGGALAEQPPGDESPDHYLTGSPRHSWAHETGGAEGRATLADGPDVLTYRSAPFDQPTALAGPTAARLFVESTTTEMDLFVRLAAEYADGGVVPLQRGMLRATHRGIDPDRTRYDDDGDVTRPYHYHTNPEPITPGEVYGYNVEVWPVAHVFRPGDRLVARIHSPPLTDGLWGYEPAGQTGLNTVYHDADRASRLNVPLVPLSEDSVPPARPCGAPEDYRCYDGYGP